jgi:hypothetical protein
MERGFVTRLSAYQQALLNMGNCLRGVGQAGCKPTLHIGKLPSGCWASGLQIAVGYLRFAPVHSPDFSPYPPHIFSCLTSLIPKKEP